MEWVLLSLFILVWYCLMFIDTPVRIHARSWWTVFSVSYIALHIIHWLLTVVGVRSSPALFALACMPCVASLALPHLTVAAWRQDPPTSSSHPLSPSSLTLLSHPHSHSSHAQRDGYMVSLTAMLRLPAFMQASSARPTATCWMSAPMPMKWKLFFLNALFWFVVSGQMRVNSLSLWSSPLVAP